jgi:hypothetical protein
MEYVLGFALTFKCVFCYDFISIFFYKDSIYDTWWKKKMDWKKLQQEL